LAGASSLCRHIKFSHIISKFILKKPHYHLLAPAFICCIKIHFICPFHRVPNRHSYPPSSPSAKQDQSILLTGTSITPYHHTMPYLVASAHLHHLHLDLP
jgi:hypothetical protein